MEKSSKKKRGKKEFLAQKLADYKKQKKISFRAKNGKFKKKKKEKKGFGENGWII